MIVHAATDQTNPIALIVPVQSTLIKLATERGIKDDNFSSLIQNPATKDLVVGELQKTAHKVGLASAEIIRGVVLTDFEWTSHNVCQISKRFTPRSRLVQWS